MVTGTRWLRSASCTYRICVGNQNPLYRLMLFK